MCSKYYHAGFGSSYGAAFRNYSAKQSSARQGMWWEDLRRGLFRRPKYNVPINIVDQETQYEVHVYALSFDKDNIRVSVEDDVLYVRGIRTVDQDNLPRFRRQEYPVKSFERRIGLYGEVDIAKITARHENGVLIVTLPKSPEAQSHGQEINID